MSSQIGISLGEQNSKLILWLSKSFFLWFFVNIFFPLQHFHLLGTLCRVLGFRPWNWNSYFGYGFFAFVCVNRKGGYERLVKVGEVMRGCKYLFKGKKMVGIIFCNLKWWKPLHLSKQVKVKPLFSLLVVLCVRMLQSVYLQIPRTKLSRVESGYKARLLQDREE